MPVPMYVVDAFTSRPFSGNPAGVCLLTEPADMDWMQSVAAEMKHAETAFLVPREDGLALRWFTPTTEVDLCGHATLASAHILWEIGYLGEEEEAVFHTKSGVLTCTRHGYGIQMDFPAERARGDARFDGPGICAALGLTEAAKICANRMDVLLEVAAEKIVRSLDPDFAALGKFDVRGIIVTARSDSPDFDFVSRFFAPAAGIDEDPATGSAHCFLGPYWAEILGRTDLIGYQCSPRGGTVRTAIRGDRVLLQGHAVTTLKGEFLA